MWGAKHAREKLLAQPFPAGWNSFLERNVAYFRRLEPDEQVRIRKVAHVMAAEKTWEGCHDLEVTEEMKVTIGGQAGLMLLGMEHSYFDRVPTILVYPSGFRIPQDRFQEGAGGFEGVIGEAVYRGPVILAWDEVVAQGRHPAQGENVVIHEFAHQLDFLDGYAGGTPELPDAKQAEHWERVMAVAYENHLHDLRMDRETLLGEYAGSNRTEFFAVVCERFFMTPKQFRRFYPELQELLLGYFGVDPIKWAKG
jgi:MtfA peptidase